MGLACCLRTNDPSDDDFHTTTTTTTNINNITATTTATNNNNNTHHHLASTTTTPSLRHHHHENHPSSSPSSPQRKKNPPPSIPSPYQVQEFQNFLELSQCCRKKLNIEMVNYILDFCDFLGEAEVFERALQRFMFAHYENSLKFQDGEEYSLTTTNAAMDVNNNSSSMKIFLSSFESTNSTSTVVANQTTHLLANSQLQNNTTTNHPTMGTFNTNQTPRTSSPRMMKMTPNDHSPFRSTSIFDLKVVQFECNIFRKFWNDAVSMYITPNSDKNQQDPGEDEELFNPFVDTEPFNEKLCNKLIRIAFGKKGNTIISLIRHYDFSEIDKRSWKSFPIFGKGLLSFKAPSFIDLTYFDEYFVALSHVNTMLEKNSKLRLKLTLPVNMENNLNESDQQILAATTDISFVEEVHSKFISSLLRNLAKLHNKAPNWVLPSLTLSQQEKFAVNDDYLGLISTFPIHRLKITLNFYHPSLPTKYLEALLGNTSIRYLEIENIKLTGQLVENIKDKITFEKIWVSPESRFIALFSRTSHLRCLVINGGISFHEPCLESLQKAFPAYMFE
ncbi:hypothetical protein C9374_005058 [Naegleria lovaniensis]|uniref:Uncharacterized protein n=1 Tax=Naegleria lovaniensis TaxID=51637 RepID=A0AA88GQ35_NAELO|nr:uncharacterized protein C9374_005058 [Naegleria lovaniensis]KAG2382478.1 hypothetical protein C9374_005058 [Naegleria lovaniensis]